MSLTDTASTTSTPSYKHGRHTDPTLNEIIRAITAEPVRSQHKRGPSVHILADSCLERWPPHDNICVLDYHAWNIRRWVEALRAETVRIQCNTVILYLEKAQEFSDVLPLKNILHTICKVIRQHNKGTRIFITNWLPSVTSSPLAKAKTRNESEFLLLQAVRSINRALHKVHFMSTYEHFVAKDGKIISLVDQYFPEGSTQLTRYGCMILLECFLRETGLKTYWF